jgi:uncharacterized protein YdeI (YjbR/CyaY-like superfamily)
MQLKLYDKEPTVARVREYLAFTGSQTTLQKYLKEWRLKCFQSYGANCSKNKNMKPEEVAKLQEENQTLKAAIAKMEEHNKMAANEFAKTERKNIELSRNLTQLESQLHLLEKEYSELKKEKQHAEILYRELKEERDMLLGRMELDKDQLIASLREELR